MDVTPAGAKQTSFRCSRRFVTFAVLQQRPIHYYATLGLHAKCTPEQIRDAYRILAKKFHPDLNPGSISAVRKTQELNEAYEILSDPERRRAYDDSLAAGDKPKATARAGKVQKNVSQDVTLFSGTLLDNLRFAKPDATMEEVKEACNLSNASQFIDLLPNG